VTYRALFSVFLVMVGAGQARGELPGTGDLATADALFVDGKRLAAEQRFAEACARFGASMALSPRLGVALNLADCYEHLGRTASAWVAFGEAAALARRLGDLRETFALDRQAALAPRLSRIRIAPAGAVVEGLVVMRDGARVQPEAYGVDVPVDPGHHVVDVTAPGRRPWSAEVTISGEGELVTVEVPELERAPAPPVASVSARVPVAVARPATPTSFAPDPGRRRTTPALWIALGASAAGIGAGTGFGLAARSLWRQARPDCDASSHCSDAAAALVDRSRRDGDLSTGAFALGGAALITAVVLYVTAPRTTPVRVTPELASGGARVAVSGVW
jgi:hypothetical protein